MVKPLQSTAGAMEAGFLLEETINKQEVFVVLPTGCGKSLIFQLVPKVCEYLHSQGFEYPKAAILVVVCLLSALINSHVQELEDHSISACSLTDQTFLKMTFLNTNNNNNNNNNTNNNLLLIVRLLH